MMDSFEAKEVFIPTGTPLSEVEKLMELSLAEKEQEERNVSWVGDQS